MPPINGLGSSVGPALIRPPEVAGEPGARALAFRDALSEAIGQVEGFRLEADAKVGKFLAGEGEDLHTVALATQRAELAFELFLQVRNKVVSAYQEVMRMQV
ncbi:MAG: flagellar hook-basal body complex protein FliE [Bryobacteraceae bacterium]|nr:flagellar hook-basal body complex protein FliE [Bryobacteraceae bacterium]